MPCGKTAAILGFHKIILPSLWLVYKANAISFGMEALPEREISNPAQETLVFRFSLLVSPSNSQFFCIKSELIQEQKIRPPQLPPVAQSPQGINPKHIHKRWKQALTSIIAQLPASNFTWRTNNRWELI